MQKVTEDNSLLLAILAVERSALQWKTEMVKSWLSVLARWFSK
jgi:hypothetical protein